MTRSKKPISEKARADDIEGDPERGDAILRRMLTTKPKQHKDMVAERKAKRDKANK